MTITNTTTRMEYPGNGVTTVFPYTFPIIENSDLEVYLLDNSTNPPTQTLQVINTDYTVSGVQVSTGGNVTMFTAPTSDEDLVIVRSVPLTQTAALKNQNEYYAYIHENEFDKLTMITQQLQAELDRAFKIPITQASSTIPTTYPTANTVLMFDGTNYVWDVLGGGGDVVGPGSSTDRAIPRFDGTSGSVLLNSEVILDDSNNVSGVVLMSAQAFIPTGSSIPTNGLYLPSANTLGFATNTTAVGSISSVGAWALGPANVGTGHAVNGFLTVQNLSGGSANGAVIINTDGTGDAYTRWGVSATTWVAGIDNSASDTFKLNVSTSASGISPSSGTELFQITTAGQAGIVGPLCVGTLSYDNRRMLIISGTPSGASGAANQGVRCEVTFGSTALTSGYSFYSTATTANVSFTCQDFTDFYANATAKGAASTITRRRAFGGNVPTDGNSNSFISDNLTFSGSYGIHLTSTNPNVLTGPTAIGGTTTNDSAAAGFVGQFLSANPGAPVNVATSTNYVTVTSISLTAGDWDVDGMCQLNLGTGTSFTRFSSQISLTNNAEDTDAQGGVNTVSASISGISQYPTGMRRISVASTTTVYLVGRADYSSAGTANYDIVSFIRARRVR